MRSTIVSLVPFLFLLPAALAELEYCTANQDGAIPGWVNEAWQSNMTDCLERMNADNFDGNVCIPADANGERLGPRFNFWKGEEHASKDGLWCFQQCSSCLMRGINWKQAQTTSCKAVSKNNVFLHDAVCTMGFDYVVGG